MKKIFKILPLLLVSVFALSGCMGNSGINPENINYIQLEEPKAGDEIAIFDTSLGEITVLLYTDEVPEIVENFKYLVESGYYNNTNVFRVEPEYMLTAFGSSDKEGNEADSIDGKPQKIQYSNNLWPFSGSLCTITHSQGGVFKNYYYDSRSFFLGDVELIDYDREQMEATGYPTMMKYAFEAMGGVPAYSQYHSVFGKVISGMDIVNAMANVDYTEEPISEEDLEKAEKRGIELITVKRPAEEIIIKNVTISTYDAANFESLDNCLTADEIEALKQKAAEEQAKIDAAAVGETE